MNPSAATVLNDRYALTERIAAGDMGEVWATTDTVLGRTVAVKLLNPALSQEHGFLERFQAQARCSAALHHPNITTVFDYGLDDGRACLVMEFVAGQPLSQLILERAPLSAQTTASILNGTRTYVSTASTSPTPSQVSATKSTGTTSEDSSMPAQPSRTAGRARGHDQHKDGKK